MIDRWLEDVNSAELVSIGLRNDIANANMGIFQLDAESSEDPTLDEIVQFMGQVFRAYVDKLPQESDRFWFYCWVDEPSGTLRCSAVPAASAMDLPFGCRLATVDNAEVIAKEFLANPYNKGIPMEALGTSKESSEQDASRLVLTVFARPFAER